LVRFVRAIARSWRDPEFRGLFVLVVVTLLSGTLFYRQVEGWSFLDSLYFSVVTLTTVGHGDLSPTTAAGKVLHHPVRLRGAGIVRGFVNAVAERSQERQSEARERRRQRRGPGGKRSSRLQTLCWDFPHVDRELGRR
jgi:voltage-gated potassium channel